MDDCNIFEALGQVSSGEARSIFRNFLRGSANACLGRTPAWEPPQTGGHLAPSDTVCLQAFFV